MLLPSDSNGNQYTLTVFLLSTTWFWWIFQGSSLGESPQQMHLDFHWKFTSWYLSCHTKQKIPNKILVNATSALRLYFQMGWGGWWWYNYKKTRYVIYKGLYINLKPDILCYIYDWKCLAIMTWSSYIYYSDPTIISKISSYNSS